MKLLIIPLLFLYACLGAMCQQHTETSAPTPIPTPIVAAEPTPTTKPAKEELVYFRVENKTGRNIEVTVVSRAPTFKVAVPNINDDPKFDYPYAEVTVMFNLGAVLTICEEKMERPAMVDLSEGEGGVLIIVTPEGIEVSRGAYPQP